ncbi:MAG: hypothetical protein EBX52_08975, partial [Proteobacteria bacterium]|nr:hypothetical protein [Pseudomonadota bacterium]
SLLNWSTNSPFGFSPYLEPEATLNQNDFWAFTNPTTSAPSETNSTTDFLSGLGDFFSGVTQNLPGLVNFGLNTWQSVEQLIAQQNPQDTLTMIPGSNIPVVKRTQGGQTSYYPITQLYPSLAPQVQQAQQNQNSWVGPVLLAGVAGLGLFLILKKK